MSYQTHFVPLESDPDIFTELMQDLGVSESLRFTDVWSIEDEVELARIPRPALALIIIFPDEYLVKPTIPGFLTKSSSQDFTDKVIWFKQTINNACGLYAILHAICNSPAKNLVKPDSVLETLLCNYQSLDSSTRPKLIEDSEQIKEAYVKAAQQGSTQPPSATAEVECHYVCFTKATEEALWLLDGDRDGPLESDKTIGRNEDILEGAALKMIRDFIQHSSHSNSCNFGIMALVPCDRPR